MDLKDLKEKRRRLENKILYAEKQLKKFDNDYKTIQECKQLLAASSTFFGDFLTQCDDIKKIFDRATIEGKYDSYQITFNNKNIVFGYLDNIVSSTQIFSELCENIKSKIDRFGINLDDACIEIAEKAKKIASDMSGWEADLSDVKYWISTQGG